MLTQEEAEMIQGAIGRNAETWQTGGNVWLVVLKRPNGSMVVFGGDCVCEYKDEEAYDNGEAKKTIYYDDETD